MLQSLQIEPFFFWATTDDTGLAWSCRAPVVLEKVIGTVCKRMEAKCFSSLILLRFEVTSCLARFNVRLCKIAEQRLRHFFRDTPVLIYRYPVESPQPRFSLV